MKIIKSPLYYTGNKYSLIESLKLNIPHSTKYFYDLFGGSGVVSINFANKKDRKVFYNEKNPHIYFVFKKFIEGEFSKEKFLKTYEKFPITEKNYKNFLVMQSKETDLNEKIWLCYYYSWFNFQNIFSIKDNGDIGNRSIGNRYDIKNRMSKFEFEDLNLDISVSNKSFDEIDIIESPDTYVYLDPPYLSTKAHYNKGWSFDDEIHMLNFLDNLSKKNIKWGMSNVFKHNGIHNIHLEEWALKNKYYVYKFKKEYTLGTKRKKLDNRHSGNETIEVFVTNFKEAKQQLELF